MKHRKMSHDASTMSDQLQKTKDNEIRGMGFAVSIKWVSLVALVVQSTLFVLTMRYSRVQDGPMYASSTAVVCAEILKIVLSFLFLAREQQGQTLSYLKEEFFTSDTLKLAVPGLLYTIQNNLLFLALSNLEVAVYQVTYQIKILTTALMSYMLLGRALNRNQITALFLLTFGVAIVQLAASNEGSSDKATDGEESQNYIIGLIAVLLASLTSGFAGVYTEKMLKHGRNVSLFMRNIQLTVFGVVLGFLGVVASDWDKVSENGFFYGYNWIVWSVVVNQAFGGLMVAAVMKYADNILKGFATSISIVFGTYISTLLFDFQITSMFMVGAMVVIGAVFLYSHPPTPLKSSFIESKV